MSPEEFHTLARSYTSVRSVLNIHPLKLAKLHRELFALPEPLFLQQGCGAMFDQLGSAIGAIAKMTGILGKSLQVPLRELALRQVGSWPLLVQSAEEARAFLLRWDPRASRWGLHSTDEPTRMRRVESVDDGVVVAVKWAQELDARELEDEAELEVASRRLEDEAELRENVPQSESALEETAPSPLRDPLG